MAVLTPETQQIIGDLRSQIDRLETELIAGKRRNAKKLTGWEVDSLRKAWQSGRFTKRELGDMFGIHPSNVGRTIAGRYHAKH